MEPTDALMQRRFAALKIIKVALLVLFCATAVVALLKATSPIIDDGNATGLQNNSSPATGVERPPEINVTVTGVSGDNVSSAKAGAEQKSSGQDQSKERFDHLVREDFFAGFAGDQSALDRAMKTCEDAIVKDPNHAEAIVWHGSGLVFASGQAFRKGEIGKGIDLWQRGLKEMDAAVELQPANLGVLLPRGSSLLEASKYTPNRAEGRALLEKGVGDYEKVLEMQKPYFNQLSIHSRGELLSGLAEGWHRLGAVQKARGYFQRIINECAGSVYAERARGWLDRKPLSENRAALSCVGCHNN